MYEKIYRLTRIIEITGLSRSTIHLAMKNGEFPKGVKLGKRAVGWPATVIDEWIKKKINTG